jgi:uncharacterized protein
VVDFGAFVDIGLHDSGLVHISQLSSRYVRDPHDVVSVGQIVKVWVLELDKARRRVALTMISPVERERQQQAVARKRERPARSGAAAQAGRGGAPAQAGGGDAPARQPAAAGSRSASAPRPPRPQAPARGKPPREQRPKSYVARAKKEVAPISDAMKQGREPLRTFGDLKQFFTSREGDAAEPAVERVTEPAVEPSAEQRSEDTAAE